MKLNSFFRFGIVGALGFFVDAGVLYGLLCLGLDYFSGRVVSFLVAVTFTWQLNRRFTFIQSSQLNVWREAWRYLLSSSLGGLVNIIIYSFVVIISNPLPIIPLVGIAFGSAAGACVNYLAAKNFVFQSK